MLTLISKLKATLSTFITKKVTFNKKKVLNALDTFDITEIKTIITKKPKTLFKKNKKQKN